MNAETPETGPQSGRGATNPGAPVSPDAEPVSSRVSSQAREELIRLLDESHDTAAGWRPWNFGHGADAILAAGWRPPLPEPGASPWDAYVKAYREFQETRPYEVAPHASALHMHALDAALRVYDPNDPEMAAERRAEAEEFERVEFERDEARLRAASWWEAAKHYAGVTIKYREMIGEQRSRADAAEAKLAADQVATLNMYSRVFAALGLSITASWSGLADAAAKVRAERDEARAKLDQVREVLAEDAETRARFQVDISTSYGPRFLNRIRAIVGEVQR